MKNNKTHADKIILEICRDNNGFILNIEKMNRFSNYTDKTSCLGHLNVKYVIILSLKCCFFRKRN